MMQLRQRKFEINSKFYAIDSNLYRTMYIITYSTLNTPSLKIKCELVTHLI